MLLLLLLLFNTSIVVIDINTDTASINVIAIITDNTHAGIISGNNSNTATQHTSLAALLPLGACDTCTRSWGRKYAQVRTIASIAGISIKSPERNRRRRIARLLSTAARTIWGLSHEDQRGWGGWKLKAAGRPMARIPRADESQSERFRKDINSSITAIVITLDVSTREHHLRPAARETFRRTPGRADPLGGDVLEND